MGFYDDYIADGLYDPDENEWDLEGDAWQKKKKPKPTTLPRCFLSVDNAPFKAELREASHLVFVEFRNGEYQVPPTTVGCGVIGNKTFKQVMRELDFKPTHYDIIQK